MDDWTAIAKTTDIEENTYKVYEFDDTDVVIFNADGEYYALEDLCTHDGAELSGGPVEDGKVMCPRHGALFCIKSGRALTPPAYNSTKSYPLRIVGDDILISAA